jgi:hypothetical protein
MSHPKTILVVLATAMAPVLAQAEERSQPQPAPHSQPAESSGPDGKGTPQDHTGTKERGSTGWTGGSREQNKTEPDVGSRALTSPLEQGAATPEMATGADLKGPPVRFAPADTPE